MDLSSSRVRILTLRWLHDASHLQCAYLAPVIFRQRLVCNKGGNLAFKEISQVIRADPLATMFIIIGMLKRARVSKIPIIRSGQVDDRLEIPILWQSLPAPWTLCSRP